MTCRRSAAIVWQSSMINRHWCAVRRAAAVGSSRHPELFALTLAHIDCDAFYASVEKRDRPELAAKPVIVGGGMRGVVTAACYVARMYGVRSAMPMFKALKACPDAVVIRPDFAKYVAASRQVRALMGDAHAAGAAAVDRRGGAGSRRHRGAARRAAGRGAGALRRARWSASVGVTVSIGLAPNRLLAKIAAGRDKPRGFAVIGAAEARVAAGPRTGAAAARRRPRAGAQAGGAWASRDSAICRRWTTATRCAGSARTARPWSRRARGEDDRACRSDARDQVDQRRDDLRHRPDADRGPGTARSGGCRKSWRAD